MPAVSVIVPVYKVEPYIARCARSLFGQTLQDLEFIFVDDCSPDRSMEVLREVLEEFPDRKDQVHCIHLQENGGLVNARLVGAAEAKGTYIIHCDSDDDVDPDAYRMMYEKAVAEDLDIVTCDFTLLGLKKTRVQHQQSAPGREVADILSDKVWGNIWCRLCKRKLWEDMIPPKADMWEDMVFTIQAITKAKRIGYIPVPLYFYYRRIDSICFAEGQQAALKRWTSMLSNVQLLLEYLQRCPDVKYDAKDIVLFKYRTRAPLVPYVQISSFYRRWRNTYPEVDHTFLWTKGISWDDKFWFLLIHLRLYYPWKKVTGFFRNRNKGLCQQ